MLCGIYAMKCKHHYSKMERGNHKDIYEYLFLILYFFIDQFFFLFGLGLGLE